MRLLSLATITALALAVAGCMSDSGQNDNMSASPAASSMDGQTAGASDDGSTDAAGQ